MVLSASTESVSKALEVSANVVYYKGERGTIKLSKKFLLLRASRHLTDGKRFWGKDLDYFGYSYSLLLEGCIPCDRGKG